MATVYASIAASESNVGSSTIDATARLGRTRGTAMDAKVLEWVEFDLPPGTTREEALAL